MSFANKLLVINATSTINGSTATAHVELGDSISHSRVLSSKTSSDLTPTSGGVYFY